MDSIVELLDLIVIQSVAVLLGMYLGMIEDLVTENGQFLEASVDKKQRTSSNFQFH